MLLVTVMVLAQVGVGQDKGRVEPGWAPAGNRSALGGNKGCCRDSSCRFRAEGEAGKGREPVEVTLLDTGACGSRKGLSLLGVAVGGHGSARGPRTCCCAGGPMGGGGLEDVTGAAQCGWPAVPMALTVQAPLAPGGMTFPVLGSEANSCFLTEDDVGTLG